MSAKEVMDALDLLLTHLQQLNKILDNWEDAMSQRQADQ